MSAATTPLSQSGMPTIPQRDHETAPMTRPGEATRRDRQLHLILAVCFLVGGGILLSVAVRYCSSGDSASVASDPKSSDKTSDKKRRGRMSIHDDPANDGGDTKDKSDDDDDDGGDGDDDEFEVVKDASGRKRVIRRLRL